MRHDIIIGIDPDTERDGIAVLHPATREISVSATPFGRTLETIRKTYEEEALPSGKDLVVVIEAGWLNRGNYHVFPGDTQRTAAYKGVSQGRNHQRGMDIQEYCEYNHIPCLLKAPLRKCWLGRDRKITQAEMEQFTGRLRTTDSRGRPAMPNQEMRDAALLAWTEAGLPVHIGIR